MPALERKLPDDFVAFSPPLESCRSAPLLTTLSIPLCGPDLLVYTSLTLFWYPPPLPFPECPESVLPLPFFFPYSLTFLFVGPFLTCLPHVLVHLTPLPFCTFFQCPVHWQTVCCERLPSPCSLAVSFLGSCGSFFLPTAPPIWSLLCVHLGSFLTERSLPSPLGVSFHDSASSLR